MPVSGPECARFIVSPHVVGFIISRVKSANIMKFNWISKIGYVAWGNFINFHTERKKGSI